MSLQQAMLMEGRRKVREFLNRNGVATFTEMQAYLGVENATLEMIIGPMNDNGAITCENGFYKISD